MAEHSRLSASSAHRWINCAGSIKLSEGIALPPPHPSAQVGTVVHKLGEIALQAWIDKKEVNLMDFLETNIDGIDIDREMILGAEMYKEYVLNLTEPGGVLKLEAKLNLSYIHKDLWGTSDAVIEYENGSISIVDLKFGTWPVDAKENPQLVYYLLGSRGDRTIPYGSVHIVQPRSKDGKKQKSWRVEKADMDRWQKIFEEKANAADIGTPIVKGEWCRFCPAKPICMLHKK